LEPVEGKVAMEAKKPYEKPQVVYREKIEVKAGACGKTGAGPCGTGPYVS
jgi:hypothetical protein